MICQKYAHCTWDHYRGYVAPADRPGMSAHEKRFWQHFRRAEWERGEMRKTEAYKARHKDGDAPPPMEPAIDAPAVPSRLTDAGVEDV
ncbi:MAG: hypothetical protein Q8S13_10495 [Dehalococcoidia bacterium]|nr:hypothetical protein [Dehalococcoidia bacterium]